MNARRWTALIIVIIVLLIVGITFFYRIIHGELWQERNGIKQVIAQSETYNLESMESLDKYVWENSYWILLANKNGSDQPSYSIWSNEGQIAELAYDDVISAEDMTARVQSAKKEAADIKLQVGYAFAQPVWEVKYRDRETSHLKIAFYSLSSGSLIDEYTIPQEARP